MNQQDLTAQPMFDAFTDTPDFTPFDHLPNTVSLNERNPSAATGPAVQRAWARWSARQDWASEDMLNMAQGNRDLWYYSHDFRTPYPGDKSVLLPAQVPGAGKPAIHSDHPDH
jgi:hypothetical protein